MAIQYQVQAQVVDLRSDTPRSADRFYVDTNVWFWTVYPNIHHAPGAPEQHRVASYANYLQKVLSAKAEVYWCGLSLSELAHQIERTEFEIYKQYAAPPAPGSLKEYRHGFPAERQRVAQEIQTAWHSIESMGRPLPAGTHIDAATTTAVLQALSALALDGHDLIAVHAMKASGLTQAMSDDGDFCLVPGITHFTANRNVIQAAQAQRKLVKR